MSATDCTLQRAINLFLRDQRDTTRRSYFYVLKSLSDYIGPARPLSAINAVLMVEYSQWVRAKPIKPTTVNKYHKTVKTFFNWCVKIELIESSPAHPLKIKPVRPRQSRDRAISDDELHDLLAFTRYFPREHAIVLFLADTGCRAGGLCSLLTEEVDFVGQHAYVTEKGDKRRQVAFGNACSLALARWLAIRPPSQHPQVFINRKGIHTRPMTSNYLGQVIRRLCNRAGVRQVSCHAFRRRKGFQFADERVPPSLAATYLGHEDVQITLNHYYPGSWEEAKSVARDFHIQIGEDRRTLYDIIKRRA